MLITRGEQSFNLGFTEKYRESLHQLRIFRTNLCDVIDDVIDDVKTPSLTELTKKSRYYLKKYAVLALEGNKNIDDT